MDIVSFSKVVQLLEHGTLASMFFRFSVNPASPLRIASSDVLVEAVDDNIFFILVSFQTLYISQSLLTTLLYMIP